MNQILITGEEVKKEKVKKEKKVLPINTIVMFYAVSIIILGICLISGSVYAKEKINAVVEANATPQINLERNDDNNTIEISVNHIRGIKTVEYKWNEEEETIIEGNNKKNVTETINLIGGVNTLTIAVTEENGKQVKYEKEFSAGNIPTIELVAVSNGVQIKSTSDEKIDYIQYSWDDQEMEKIEVGAKEYEGIINAPKGKHTLKIEVVDINKMVAKKEQPVVGDTEPTLNVSPQLVDGKVAFVINAEDDENITTIEIIHNSGKKQVINVNAATYSKNIIMTEGEVNTLIVTATNLNGLQKTRRVKFDNK